MAAKSTKGKGKRRAAIFRPVGKYFLLILIIVGQAFLAYTIVDKNYEEIYGFLNGFNSDNPGTYQLEELIVNPAGTNGQRYLLVEISLELVEKDDIKLIQDNRLKLRHGLIEFLSSRTVDQLEDFEKSESIRGDLIKIINNTVGVHSVRNLYYTKYVMQ